MIQIQQLKLPPSHTMEELYKKAAKALGIRPQAIEALEIVRKSIDARDKENIRIIYTVEVSVAQEGRILKKNHNRNVLEIQRAPYAPPQRGTQPLRHRPLVVGSGPGGLFCAYLLALQGYAPLVVEQGDRVAERREKVRAFWETGRLDPDSNVQFGEGGAGTFSDGKLNTMVKDPRGRNRMVLETFVQMGAPAEILYESRPHMGTDVLASIVRNLREEICRLGGEVRFQSKLVGLSIEGERIRGVRILNRKNMEETFVETEAVILAIGHSARDTFAMLREAGVPMSRKAFAVGLRIEHPRSMIDTAQYGSRMATQLPPASYKLARTVGNGRGVYSFCMCPGGYVVNAASLPEATVVNGMSYSGRDGRNSNSAIVVTVGEGDFPTGDLFAGVAFQESLERAAYRLGSGHVPVQLFGDFCKNRESVALGGVEPCIKGGWAFANLREILPPFLGESLVEGILSFEKNIAGFSRGDAILSGVETRTSSPLRILRDEGYESAIRGLYPCGEGAGYAGGITSAAMDGLRVAEAVISRYAPFMERERV